MKTAFFVLISVGALLSLAGCSQPRPATEPAGGGPGGSTVKTYPIAIEFKHSLSTDTNKYRDSDEHWKMTTSNGNGAFHLLGVNSNDIIEWERLPASDGPFSIVVTNANEWTVLLAAQESWRADVSCPFNETNVGVIDSTNSSGHMVVRLKVGATPQKQVGYMVTVSTVPSTLDKQPHSRMSAANDLSMVDATMQWTGDRGKGP
jgi:hypothetical protein